MGDVLILILKSVLILGFIVFKMLFFLKISSVIECEVSATLKIGRIDKSKKLEQPRSLTDN